MGAGDGASAGIGAALARELAKHGAKLILTARRVDRIEALAGELRARGAEVHIVAADLNDPAAPQKIFDATEGAGFCVDILINNAGLGQYGAFCASPWSRRLKPGARQLRGHGAADNGCLFRAWLSGGAAGC